MKKYFYSLSFFIYLINSIYSQCTFSPLSENDFNLPSFNRSECSIIKEDTAGNLFVATVEFSTMTPMVHKFNGVSWEKLGVITNTNCSYLAMAVSKSGTPYIAFRDGTNSLHLSVMSYSAGNWNYVGAAGFSGSAVLTIDLQLDKNDFPVVAFQNNTTGFGSAMKFNGTSWSTIGSQNINNNYMTYISLALDTADVPYVGFSDGTGWPSLNASVKKYDGVAWSFVGPQKFSASQADKIDLKFDKNNNLFIVYSDYFYSQNLTVKKFISPSWVNVGTPGFTVSPSGSNQLAIDTAGTLYILTSLFPSPKVNVVKFNGTTWNSISIPGNASEKAGINGTFIIDKQNRPVVAFVDQNRHYKTTVKRFNGLAWDFLGDRGFSYGVAKDNSLSLTLDKYGTPYACFSDSLNGFKATVMKYTANTWTHVGLPGFTAGIAENLLLKFDTLNVPHLCFADGSAGMLQSVMKFNGSAWVYVGSPGFSAQPSTVNYLTFYNNTPYLISGGSGYKEIYSFNGSVWNSLYNANSVFTGYNNDLKLAFDTLGHPFMLSRSSGGNIYVSKHNGTYWQTVGMSLAGVGYNADMFVERSGTPYVAYSSGTVTVKKFNGTNWISLTTNNISTSTGSSPNIRIVRDVPYLSYVDDSKGRRVVFLKFNGIQWVAAAVDSIVSAGSSSFSKLENDTAGNFYILYKSTETYAKKIKLRKTLEIVSSPSVCSGQPLTLNIFGASSYTWSTSAVANSIVVTPSITSTYNVSSFDSNNCVIYGFKTISVPQANFSIAGANGYLCIGSSATLTGNGALSYTWSPATISQSIVVSPTVSTVYTVSGQDISTLCADTKTVAVTVIPNPTVLVSPSSSHVCKLEQIAFSVTGCPILKFDGITFTGNIYYLNPTSSGIHTLTGISAYGCIDSKTVAVTVKPEPTLSIVGSTGVCLGSSISQIVTGAVTYTWSDGTNGNLITINPVGSIVLSVSGTGSNNCVGTVSTLISVYPLPMLNIQSTPAVLCSGESTTLSASGASFYKWDFGATGDQIVVNPQATKTYTLHGTDLNGCSSESTYTLVVNECTEIETFLKEVQILVFPNPNRGIVAINAVMDTRIYFYDQFGGLLFDKVVLKGTTNLNIQEYANGIYFIKYETEKGQKVFKLIKTD